MAAINYLLKRTIINSIKELKKHPFKIVAYLIFIGFMVFATLNSKKIELNSLDNSKQIFNSIFLILTLLLIYMGIKNGTEKGNTLFRMADVNFLFPAPIKAQKVLIYGFIKQIFTSLTFLLILLFQIPNIHMYFPVHSYGGILIIGNMFLLNLLCGVLSVFIYSIGSLKEGNEKIIKKILYSLVVLFGIGAIYNIAKSQDIIKGVLKYLNLPLFQYMPIIGWILNIFNAAIHGINSMTLIYAILLITLSGLLIFIVYSLNLDYYEDALESTLTKEETLSKAKKGKTVYNNKVKTRKPKGKIKYTGAKTIFSKQILEAKKIGFVFIDLSTLISTVISLVYAFFSKSKDIIALLYMLTYMNLIFSTRNNWAMEIKNHYIFLIPEPSRKKIFFATALDIIKSFINGLIAFGVATILFKISIIQGIILTFTYTSFSALFLYCELIIRRILGGKVNPIVGTFLRLIFNIIIVIPGIVLSFTLRNIVNNYIGTYGEYWILILYNIIMCSLFIFLSKGIFEKVEME